MEKSSLRALRLSFDQSLVEVGKNYGATSTTVLEMEKRFDLGNIRIDSAQALVKAMGGEVQIIARFPDHEPMDITPDPPEPGQ